MQTYSYRQAAELLGVSHSWVQQLVRKGKLKQVEVSSWRIPDKEIRKFLINKSKKLI